MLLARAGRKVSDTMNVKEVLRRGGVLGVLAAAGMDGPAAVTCGQKYGKDLAKAWDEMWHPGAMVRVALAAQVPTETVLQAAQVAVQRVVAEFGKEPLPQARRALRAVEVALGDPGHAAGLPLEAVVREGARWMATAKDDGVVCDPWEMLTVAAATMLAQATWAVVCPCPRGHEAELAQSLDSCMFTISRARLEHGEAVGRIPSGASRDAVYEWCAGHTANAIRELIPVEMVMAPTVTIPGVTEAGELVWNKRARGQA